MTAKRAAAFSLLELLVVLAVLATATLIAMPKREPTERYKLEFAAGELAEAIRYARGEAVRTGGAYGFNVEVAQNRVRVFRADLGATPPTPIYDVVDPVSKHLYTVDLDDTALATGVTLIRTATAYSTLPKDHLAWTSMRTALTTPTTRT